MIQTPYQHTISGNSSTLTNYSEIYLVFGQIFKMTLNEPETVVVKRRLSTLQVHAETQLTWNSWATPARYHMLTQSATSLYHHCIDTYTLSITITINKTIMIINNNHNEISHNNYNLQFKKSQ